MQWSTTFWILMQMLYFTMKFCHPVLMFQVPDMSNIYTHWSHSIRSNWAGCKWTVIPVVYFGHAEPHEMCAHTHTPLNKKDLTSGSCSKCCSLAPRSSCWHKMMNQSICQIPSDSKFVLVLLLLGPINSTWRKQRDRPAPESKRLNFKGSLDPNLTYYWTGV